MKTTITICGIPHTVMFVKTTHETHLDKLPEGHSTFQTGEIDYLSCSIRIYKDPPERTFQILLHEIIHGIIAHGQVRGLMDKELVHDEASIQQLSVHLAETLTSMGCFPHHLITNPYPCPNSHATTGPAEQQTADPVTQNTDRK